MKSSGVNFVLFCLSNIQHQSCLKVHLSNSWLSLSEVSDMLQLTKQASESWIGWCSILIKHIVLKKCASTNSHNKIIHSQNKGKNVQRQIYKKYIKISRGIIIKLINKMSKRNILRQVTAHLVHALMQLTSPNRKMQVFWWISASPYTALPFSNIKSDFQSVFLTEYG